MLAGHKSYWTCLLALLKRTIGLKQKGNDHFKMLCTRPCHVPMCLMVTLALMRLFLSTGSWASTISLKPPLPGSRGTVMELPDGRLTSPPEKFESKALWK